MASNQMVKKHSFTYLGKIIGVLLVALLTLLLISEVKIGLAVIATTIFALQIVAGASCLVLCTRKLSFTWQELAGFGLAIGSLLTFGFDQVFRTTAISGMAWLIPVLILPLITFQKIRSDKRVLSIEQPVSIDILLILAATLFIVATEWFWPLPIAIFLTSVFVWKEFPKYKTYSLLLSFFSLIISVITFLRRPVGWWIEDTDVALYEAMSRTLGTWGFRENINAAGNATHYHWFAYAWSGLIDRVGNAESWITNTRILPIFIALGIVLMIWSALKVLFNNRIIIICSLIAISCFDTAQSWGRGFKIGYLASPSQIYGYLLLLAFLYLFAIDQDEKTSKSLFLFALLGFGAVGAKVAHGVLLAGGVGLSWLFTLIREKKLRSHNTYRSLVTLLAITMSFVLVVGGATGSSRGVLLDQVAFVTGITGDFRQWGLTVNWIAALIFLFGFLGLQVLGLTVSWSSNLIKDKLILVFVLGIFIAGVISTLFLSAEFAVEIFFAQGAAVLVLVLIIPITISQFTRLEFARKNKMIFMAISIIGFGSAILTRFIPKNDSGSYQAIFFRMIPSLVGLLPIIFGLAFSIFIVSRSKTKNLATTFALLATIGLIFMSFGFYLSNWQQNMKQEYPEFASNSASRIGEDRPDLQAASVWISENTPESAIFATNDFCSEISASCDANTDWTELMNDSMKCTTFEVLRTTTCDAGGYPLLTAIVHRRFLAGNYYVGISDGSAIKPWVAQRVIDSVDFAKNSSDTAVEKLQKSNVQWYLLRKELTSNSGWKDFGQIRYSNDTYAVIEFAAG